jgi:hypothetical protein
VIGKGLRFLALGRGIRQGLLMRQLAGMHHDKAQALLAPPAVTIRDFYRLHDALSPPAPWLLSLRTAWFLQQQG